MTELSKDQKRDSMGMAGQFIVGNYFTNQGQKVIYSETKYDHIKDMTIDDKKVEVKTQVPFWSQHALSIKPNQIPKCRQADAVYFVAVPPAGKNCEEAGWVYKIDSSFKTRDHTCKNGRVMVLIDFAQPAVTKAFQLTDAQIKELQNYAVTE